MGNRSSCDAHRVIGASLSWIQELGSNSKGWYLVLEIYDNSEYLDWLFVALMREDSIWYKNKKTLIPERNFILKKIGWFREGGGFYWPKESKKPKFFWGDSFSLILLVRKSEWVSQSQLLTPIPTCCDCPLFVTHRRPRSWDPPCWWGRIWWATDSVLTSYLTGGSLAREETIRVGHVCCPLKEQYFWQTTEWFSKGRQ